MTKIEQELEHDFDQDSDSAVAVEEPKLKQILLSLFQERGKGLTKWRTSNTIGFYDICPKWARNGSEPFVVTDASQMVRTYDFLHQGTAYIIEVQAARIVDASGKVEYHFPSSRDELIEDVLRHLLATEKQLTFFEDNVGLQFTIYQTRQELTKYGKSRCNNDVRHSLRVLHKSNLAVFRADHYKNGMGDPLFSGPFFSDATVIDLEQYYNRSSRSQDDDDKSCKGLVKFHNMVTAGITECDFRLLRYDIVMSYKSDLARAIHKRISHTFTGADEKIPYKIKLSTLFNDANWRWQRLDKNKSKLVTALDEMAAKGQLNQENPYNFTPTNSGSPKDYMVEIFLSPQFINHIVYSNTVHRDIRLAINDVPAVDVQLNDENYDFLIENGVSEKQARALVTEYSPSRVRKNIEHAIDYAEKKSADKDNFNFAGALYKAIEDDWAKVSLSNAQVVQVESKVSKAPTAFAKFFPSDSAMQIFVSLLEEGPLKEYATGKRAALSKTDGEQMNTAIRMFLRGSKILND